MSITENSKNEIKVEDPEETAPYKIYPEIYRHINYNERIVEIEVTLPGVKKEDITLKALPNWFHVTAKRKDINAEYNANYNFGVEIVPEKTTAEYFSGLLKIHAIITDPLEKAKEVKL